MPFFDILSYKKWIKLFAWPFLQRSNVRWECQLSEQPGQWYTPYFFQIIFLWQFLIFNFLFCNMPAFLLIYKHSQSNILTEFKGLFLVRHRSSCRPIGRVEIWTANQSWEALLVNWFHPFMSKHWSVVTFHSCKLSKRCWRRLNRSYATSNIYHIIYIITQNMKYKTPEINIYR